MARLVESLIGHQDKMAPLLEAYSKGRLASALLFSGPAGIGKKLCAKALAQTLICERVAPDSWRACGACGPCLRLAKGQSESVLEIAPDGAGIKIEQARDILRFISLQKLGRARVVLIDQAHLMTPQAANALLKSLEEPPDGTYMILITSVVGAILPTIRSRTQLVRFRALSDEELRLVLGPERAEPWVLRSAHGSVEMAERLLESSEDFQELESAVVDYLTVCQTRLPLAESARIKDLTKDRLAQSYVLSCIGGMLRDALRVQAGLTPIDEKLWRVAEPLLIGKTGLDLSRLAQRSMAMEADLVRNIDRSLLFETFAIELRS